MVCAWIMLLLIIAAQWTPNATINEIALYQALTFTAFATWYGARAVVRMWREAQ